MGSLFQGSPQTATSYSTSTSETPKWMQDAIFNQVQLSQNLANRPFQSYELPTVAELSPLQQQAYTAVQGAQGSYLDDLNASQAGLRAIAGLAPLPDTPTSMLPSNMQTSAMTAGNTAQEKAKSYFDKAGKTSYDNITNYMNPYTTNVMNKMAERSARNLSENLLPAVSDAFIKAGQFGSSRMGDFGTRAVRDESENLLNAQANMMNTGYQQAMGAAQADMARQAGLGQTVAQIQESDLARQLGALNNLSNLGAQRQALGYTDTAALEAAGQAQQAQMQQQLSAAEKEFLDQQMYPMQQADFLSTQLRGLAPITPSRTTQSGTSQCATYSASPLSQIAAGLATYKGLQNLANKPA